jgi:hypothetical protein
MKTSTKIFAGITAVAILLASTGAVFADSGDFYGQGQGQGESQGQGQGRGVGSEQDGLMDDYMTAAMAEVFGLTVEEIELRYEAEDSFITIALSQGFEIEDIDGMMDDVRSIAVEIAASEGVILGRQESNQMVSQLGTKGQVGRIAGGEGAPKINMTEGECDEETCDCDSEPLYENAEGESMMRRGGR